MTFSTTTAIMPSTDTATATSRRGAGRTTQPVEPSRWPAAPATPHAWPVGRRLHAVLLGELAAVESYAQTLAKADERYAGQLWQCHCSHRERAQKVSRRILHLGGHPEIRSVAWGQIVALRSGGPRLADPITAVTTLEQCEQWWRLDCQCDMDGLDADSLSLMESCILPEQERTCTIMMGCRQALARARTC